MLTWVKVVGLTLLVLILFGACIRQYTGEFRDFNSLEELNTFLFWDDTDSQTYVVETHDCDDFAIDLMMAAEKQGYRMNLQFVTLEDGNGHVLNSVVIDGVVYFIEPQNDEVTRIGPLDTETENPSEEGLPVTKKGVGERNSLSLPLSSWH